MKHAIKLSHPKCGEPDMSHVYRDADGASVLVANRYEKPEGGKFFLPYDVTRDQWKAPDVRPIYNLDRIAKADPKTPIIMVEGEKCADVLTDLDYLATTTFGGSNAANKTDLTPLANRHVILWPDHDEPGKKYAKVIQGKTREYPEMSLHVIPIGNEMLSKVTKGNEKALPFVGWDVADAVAQGWTRKDIDHLLSFAEPGSPANTNEPPQKETSLTTISDLWHTPQREPFATLTVSGHGEHWPLDSTHFRNFLSYEHFQSEGKMLSQSALEDQRRMLQGRALFEGEEHPVFNRIGTLGRSLYIDLGNKDWQAVAVTEQGWQVVNHPPARFRRAASQQALPLPQTGAGDIELLRPFLNVASDDDFRMLVAWLVGCFHPRGPYPILILNGEQGSAKSTTARVLRSFIDPANPMARSAPGSEQDLVIAAKHNHVLAFDNLSYIKPSMADAFCRIATGGGFGTRKLHTDAEEVLFTVTRPCLLNGIPDLANRPDLADRAIIVNLPVIPASGRKYEGEFNRALESAAPRILAGLLDAVSCALANLATVDLPERPRMADFAKWITAAEPALGWEPGAFMASYTANRDLADQSSVEGNPVALAILKLLAEEKRWQGTVTELNAALRNRYPHLTDDPASFPRQVNKLSSAIRRVAPPLRRMGLIITFDRQGRAGERIIRIETQ